MSPSKRMVANLPDLDFEIFLDSTVDRPNNAGRVSESEFIRSLELEEKERSELEMDTEVNQIDVSSLLTKPLKLSNSSDLPSSSKRRRMESNTAGRSYSATYRGAENHDIEIIARGHEADDLSSAAQIRAHKLLLSWLSDTLGDLFRSVALDESKGEDDNKSLNWETDAESGERFVQVKDSIRFVKKENGLDQLVITGYDPVLVEGTIRYFYSRGHQCIAPPPDFDSMLKMQQFGEEFEIEGMQEFVASNMKTFAKAEKWEENVEFILNTMDKPKYASVCKAFAERVAYELSVTWQRPDALKFLLENASCPKRRFVFDTLAGINFADYKFDEDRSEEYWITHLGKIYLIDFLTVEEDHLPDISCDIVITTKVTDDEPEDGRIYAHRLLLAWLSPVFQRQFFGPMAKACGKLDENGHHPLTIVGYSLTTVARVLQYSYSGDVDCIPKADLETTLEMFRFADQYDMQGLCRVISGLMDTVTPTEDTWEAMVELVLKYKDLMCFDSICANLGEMCANFMEARLPKTLDVVRFLAEDMDCPKRRYIAEMLSSMELFCRNCRMRDQDCLHGHRLRLEELRRGVKFAVFSKDGALHTFEVQRWPDRSGRNRYIELRVCPEGSTVETSFEIGLVNDVLNTVNNTEVGNGMPLLYHCNNQVPHSRYHRRGSGQRTRTRSLYNRWRFGIQKKFEDYREKTPPLVESPTTTHQESTPSEHDHSPSYVQVVEHHENGITIHFRNDDI